MTAALFLFVLALIFSKIPTLEWATLLSIPFHQFCVDLAPDSKYRFAYQALVCGANLPKDEFSEALKVTSLLHLAIVSGSHLVFLESLIRRMTPAKLQSAFFILPLIFIYALLTGWQPPAVRSLFVMILAVFTSKFKIYLTPIQTTWMAGLITWSFFPMWFYSYSFLLSWSASLGLSLYDQNGRERFLTNWKTHSLVYLVLIPVLLPLTVPHPLSILCNWLIGPLLEVLLFPMSLLAFFVPYFYFLTDIIWSACEWLIIFTSKFVPEVSNKKEYSLPFLWTYLFLLMIFLDQIKTKLKRPKND